MYKKSIILKPDLIIISSLVLFLILINCPDITAQYRFKTVRDTTKYNPHSLDIKIFRTFNDINSKFVHTMAEITNEALVPVIITVPVGLYIGSKIDNNSYGENSAVLLAVSEITNGIVSQGLKFIVKRKRPFRVLNGVNLSDTSAVKGTYSFPSGHTSASFNIATSLTLRYPDEPVLIAGLYTYAALTSLGRIYWGVHYPSDVLGGMIIGAGTAALVFSLRKPILTSTNKLFNQSDRNENLNSKKINTAALFLTVAATDFINFYFSKSQNSILKNSSINIMSTSSENNIKYIYNF